MVTCPDCGAVFPDDDDDAYMEHLIKYHPDRLRKYTIKTWGVEFECPRCEKLHSTETFYPSSTCPEGGYPIGRWAFRWAARFIAANDASRVR